jgi:hypothetical protein
MYHETKIFYEHDVVLLFIVINFLLLKKFGVVVVVCACENLSTFRITQLQLVWWGYSSLLLAPSIFYDHIHTTFPPKANIFIVLKIRSETVWWPVSSAMPSISAFIWPIVMKTNASTCEIDEKHLQSDDVPPKPSQTCFHHYNHLHQTRRTQKSPHLQNPR